MLRNKIILLGLLLSSLVWSSDRRREELKRQEELEKAKQQLSFYQQELEKVKVKRWQDKRNAVAKKEAYQEAWNDLKRDVDRLQLKRTQLEEQDQRYLNQLEGIKTQLKETKLRRKEFGIQIAEKISEFSNEQRSAFPAPDLDIRNKAEVLVKALEKAKYRPTHDILKNGVTLLKSIFELGESREVTRTQFALTSNAKTKVEKAAGAKLVAGFMVRVGTIYKAFISSETNEAAILVKTGRIHEKAWRWMEDIKKEDLDALKNSGGHISMSDTKKVALFLPMDVQLRKATGNGYAASAEKPWFEALLEEMKGAGFAIYLIAGITFVALIILAEKLFIFIRSGRNGKRFAKKVFAMLEQGHSEEALALCRRKKGSVPAIMGVILKNRYKDRQRAEDKAYEVMLHESVTIEKRISTVNILAAAAPLVGLLGTVSGMVNLFGAITMHGTSDPKIMASGIGEALLSTKWGLLAAIPLLLLYNLLNNWSQGIVSNMEKYSAKTLNLVFGEILENQADSVEKDESSESEANKDTLEPVPQEVLSNV